MISQVDLHELQSRVEFAPLLASLSSPVQQVFSLINVEDSHAPRPSYLLVLEDGRRVKCRLTLNPDLALRVFTLRQQFSSPHFAKILSHSGAVLIEEWVVGQDCTQDEVTPGFLKTFGAVLAQLHSTDLQRESFKSSSKPEYWIDKFMEATSRLLAGKQISQAEESRLHAAYLPCAPSTIEVGLIHQDFCLDNFVKTECGEIVCIDNEHLHCGPFELDLARTRLRWPMSEPYWNQFIDGYQSVRRRSAGISEFSFWYSLAIVESAEFTVRQQHYLQEQSLTKLQQLITEAEKVSSALPHSD